MSWIPDHLRLSREQYVSVLKWHNATREPAVRADPSGFVATLSPSLARALLPIAKTRARAFFADPRAMRALRERAGR